jgi:hypothetical protein
MQVWTVVCHPQKPTPPLSKGPCLLVVGPFNNYEAAQFFANAEASRAYKTEIVMIMTPDEYLER